MTIDVTDLIIAVIGLCFSVVTGTVVPWLREKLGTERTQRLALAVKMAVAAAEQLFGAGSGAQKLDYVETYLRGKGLTADRTAIEAAVHELCDKAVG